MRNCSGKQFITLCLLCSALLRPLPIGDSENTPLPFSAVSVFSHGIASPLPAVSESGKVKTPLSSQMYLSSFSSNSYYACVVLPLGGLSLQLKPKANVFSFCDACMLSHSVVKFVCAKKIKTVYLRGNLYVGRL